MAKVTLIFAALLIDWGPCSRMSLLGHLRQPLGELSPLST